MNSEQRLCCLHFLKKNSGLGPNHKYLYLKFPDHFIWDGKEKEWKERTKGKSIGRITYGTPSKGERFYLRLLLANIQGPTSFTDLQQMENHVVHFKKQLQNMDFLNQTTLLKFI